MNTDSQNTQILKYLQSGATLTSLEALKLFGCLRLSGRIYDLRKRMNPIESRMIQTLTGKYVAEYFIKL